MYRQRTGVPEVLLVHPGGPFWRNKDAGAWTIPKGEIEPEEDPLATACREFQEELGFAPTGPFASLGQVKQKAGKIVHGWAFSGDCDPSNIRCNLVSLEWPPRSGKQMQFPEIDRAEFFSLKAAAEKINAAQVEFLHRLAALIASPLK